MASTYVVTIDELGTIAFSGNILITANGSVEIFPRDPIRRNVHLASCGILVTVDVESIDTLALDLATR
jgi:Family of unknown function (DUF5695)